MILNVKSADSLPIDAALPELREALRQHRNVVLSAEPGAGKTTRVPIVLLNEDWLLGRKIIMLEPRRLAAQRAAAYMSQLLNEPVGETVGYRIRGDTKIGKRTRIEVVTEGILTRMLQDDPSLPDVALVIFDEFHERSIHADLGLALTLDVQEHLRNDLRILVMSATLDGLTVASLLGDAGVINSQGRTYPVVTRYASRPPDGPIEPLIVATIIRALREENGDVLVFLPGQREIRHVKSMLEERELPPSTVVHMLYGEAPPRQQQDALQPSPVGKRKVILSTSVAETSLTINGVRVVIDSGLSRQPRFDPSRGMSGLVTVPVSQSSAEQRRGRAGRQQPGVCYRLWTERQHTQLPKFVPPEILVADLAPLALELARWGTPSGDGLRFLDPPPSAHLSRAQSLLSQLGAVDDHGKLSPHGRAMAELPTHPRLAHMLIKGKELRIGALACDVAALLDERDLLRGERDTDIDLHSRWYALRKGEVPDRFTKKRMLTQSARLKNLIGVGNEKPSEDKLGMLLALAYPERVAKRRASCGARYQMAGGTGAVIPKGSMLSREPYLAIGGVDGIGSEVTVFLAEPISEDDIKTVFADRLIEEDEVCWDSRQEEVIARRVTRLGAFELSAKPLAPTSELVKTELLKGIRAFGLSMLPWSKRANSVRTRSEWLRTQGLVGEDWEDLSDQHLTDTLAEWLGSYLDGITKRSQLSRLDMSAIIDAMFSHHQQRELEKMTPTHLTVPTGSRIPIEYSISAPPVLAVRLQEMFGETETPTVAGGKVKVVLHLLSPAHRPIAVTQDLPSFWKNAYPNVRKEMRGRYPKHHWPENPLEAKPTKRSKHQRK